jgi:hypothetical protein
MKWTELEKQFRDLEQVLVYFRLDIQWGDNGEFWRDAGTSSLGSETVLSEIGGGGGNFSLFYTPY